MPATSAADAAAFLADAWRRYAASAAVRLEVLEAAAAALAAGRLDEGLRAGAVHEAHKLAGSLGLFGVARGSELAWECEQALGADGSPEATRIAALVRGIRDELAASAGPIDG